MTSIISRPVVAIAGATGHLGRRVVSALLSPRFNEQFSDVILLSRNELSPESFEAGGKYTIRKYDEDNLVDALRGVQILINTVGPLWPFIQGEATRGSAAHQRPSLFPL